MNTHTIEEQEDMFCEFLDRNIPEYETPNDKIYRDMYDFIFDPLNWLEIKNVSYKGTWVSIQYEGNINLHYAKKVKVRSKAGLSSILKQQFNLGNTNDPFTIESEKIFIEDLTEKVKYIETISKYRLQMISVKIKKRKSSYYLPCQYNIPSESMLSLFEYVGKSKFVKYTKYYEIQDVSDKIYYLMSRGIKREKAEILVERQNGFLSISPKFFYQH